jgi:hypothetical protein
MYKLSLLACLLVSVVASAQSAPKVVFVGDNVTGLWAASPEFIANKNWSTVLSSCCFYDTINFQNVINQHPAYVHIMVGYNYGEQVDDAVPVSEAFSEIPSSITQMVAMAKAANIKVILGSMIYLPGGGENTAVVTYLNAWLDQYGRANDIPVVNYNTAFCTQQCPAWDLVTPVYLPQYEGPNGISDAGFALLTQMAQTAIATYSLTIKGGYLSNVELWEEVPGEDLCCGPNPYGPPFGTTTPQVNTVTVGHALLFTPQATWNDGVTRPMLNQNFDRMQGIWTSSNPNVMYINQQGQALSIGPGTTSISFVTASGSHFSPWTMYVQEEDATHPYVMRSRASH